ncbi:MAG: hypothetical protein HDT11_00905 [Helicobacter sp.]|nr:hypothetical protein [Helicobacter sp.]
MQDKILLLVSSALFGLMTFLLENSQNSHYFVKVLLILNALSLVSALLSFYYGNKDIEIGKENAKKYYLEEKKCFFNKKSCWFSVSKKLNAVSLWSLAAVIIALAILLCFA